MKKYDLINKNEPAIRWSGGFGLEIVILVLKIIWKKGNLC